MSKRTRTIPWLLLLLVALAPTAVVAQLKPSALLDGMAPDASELDMRKTPVVRAVERAADSVVSIYVLQGRQSLRGQGSGVIIDESGLVITNWHVIAPVAANPRASEIRVKLKDGRSFDGTLLSSSPIHDLALLQLGLSGDSKVNPMVAGDSGTLMVGETVIAIGNPQGHANSVTVGVLSQTDRSITVRAPDGVVRTYEGLLQTDAAINQGNSGGALLDITGKLIGINNAMAVGSENIGFAIPVNMVKQVFEDVLLSSDHLANVWFGLKVRDVQGQPTIESVTAGGPAQRAGLRGGDRLMMVGDRRVKDALDYARAVVGARADRPFAFQVDRRGRSMRVNVTPTSNAEWEIVRRVGMELTKVTRSDDDDLVRRATLEFYRDSRRTRVPALPVVLRVEKVYRDSPAAEIGLEAGDVLVGLQVSSAFGSRNVYVRSIDDLADRLRSMAGYSIPVIVLRDDEGLYGDIDVRRLYGRG